MRKPKIPELDLVRGAAILAVLLIHGTSEATVDIPLGSRTQALYVAVNMLSNFAVPLFILMSGVVLFYRYEDGWNFREALNFYRKRIQYVVVPYLLWSFFYYIYTQWLASYSFGGVKFDWADFFQKLKWADVPGAYHLYFIIIIVQLYLLFPLLMTAVKQLPLFGKYLAPIGIAGQVAFYYIQFHVHPFVHRPSLFFTYIGLFCIGGAIGLNYGKVREASTRHLWWVFAAATALGFSLLMFKILADHKIGFGQAVYELLFYSYPVAICVSFLWIGEKAVRTLPRLSAWLTSLGAASFGIYFIHPAVLSAWRRHFTITGGSHTYHLFTLAGFILALAVPWLIVTLLKKWRGSWILLGR